MSISSSTDLATWYLYTYIRGAYHRISYLCFFLRNAFILRHLYYIWFNRNLPKFIFKTYVRPYILNTPCIVFYNIFSYIQTVLDKYVWLIYIISKFIKCVCMKLLKNSWHNKIPPFSQLRDAAHKAARHYKKRPLDIILMTFYFRLIGKHFELSNATKSTGNLTKTNLEDNSVLVIILSSLLSISVLVLVVGIVKKILKAYPIKRNTFRRENKGGELFKWKLNINLL